MAFINLPAPRSAFNTWRAFNARASYTQLRELQDCAGDIFAVSCGVLGFMIQLGQFSYPRTLTALTATALVSFGLSLYYENLAGQKFPKRPQAPSV